MFLRLSSSCSLHLFVGLGICDVESKISSHFTLYVQGSLVALAAGLPSWGLAWPPSASFFQQPQPFAPAFPPVLEVIAPRMAGDFKCQIVKSKNVQSKYVQQHWYKEQKGCHMISLSDSTSKSSRVRLMSFSLSFSKDGAKQ